MLIDYEWCTGCHSCETACQMEHHLPVGQFGIKLNEIGPFEYAPDRWQLSYVPVPTDLCDFCDARAAQGQDAACVHHCLAKCMEIVEVEDVSARLAALGKTAVCFVP